MNDSAHDVVTDVRESLVVLTHDGELLQTLRAVATDHDISAVGAEADLAAHLLDGRAGVAVLDTDSVTTPINQLCDRLKSQFPDLVLVIAGRHEDQGPLTTQITRGTVYRFLHKPVSEQRVRLFVTAAWRRHGVEHAEVLEATATNLRKPVWSPPKPPSKKLMWIGGTAALVLIVGAALIFSGGEKKGEVVSADAPVVATPRGTVDNELEELLKRADDAMRRGALVTPPGDNATELYRLAIRRNGGDPRGTAGLDRVLDRVLTATEQALLQDKIDDAARFVETARTINPDHVRVAFLTAQIGKERERALLTQARQAAARGNVEQAIAVLDRASLGGTSANVVAEARSDIAQRGIDNRVNDFLRRANDRLRAGALVEPAQDNARFFIESARAIAPNQSDVRLAQRQLNDRIVSQARAAITAGNAEEADKWVAAAGDSGVSQSDVTSLTRDVQRIRIAARADSMAKLSQSFNQRLAQGRLVDPANDSAKFYLTELAQAEANHPSTQIARQALGSRMLEEARGAIAKQDYAAARRWMSEAKDVGIAESGTAALEHDIVAAQNAGARQAPDDIVNASSQLILTRSVKPNYPQAALERGREGWVDLVFTVRADGTITDIGVTAAEPAGIFEKAAMAAVRRWRYEPVKRDGRVVEQRARLRLRFSIE
ncbi:MAG: TonB family protein [Gammaproteobacteria bacterium]